MAQQITIILVAPLKAISQYTDFGLLEQTKQVHIYRGVSVEL